MSDEITEALIRQKIALMSDDEFDRLVRNTRPPKVDRGAIAAAESEGRWRDAAALKAAQLWQQINDENRKLTEG